ncbi:MAG: tRNA (adenosine(37)-N6)-dimethylallyltransferase MiaA [Treponemataceae bacterium]
MQVYKDLNIGTAKPSKNLLAKLPHHLIDICAPSEQFSTSQFIYHADKACKDIFLRKKIPVLLGGTAFYIKNFLYGLPITPQADLSVRKKLQQECTLLGKKKMFEKLLIVDSTSADKINQNDEYRILRALEVFEATGKPLSSFTLPHQLRNEYDFCIIALDRPREQLYKRINERVEIMFKAGLESEVSSLIQQGFTQETTGMKAIGYREFFLETESTKRELLIKQNSRKYAKRQLTFFKTIKEAVWIDADDDQNTKNLIEAFLKKISLF